MTSGPGCRSRIEILTVGSSAPPAAGHRRPRWGRITSRVGEAPPRSCREPCRTTRLVRDDVGLNPDSRSAATTAVWWRAAMARSPMAGARRRSDSTIQPRPVASWHPPDEELVRPCGRPVRPRVPPGRILAHPVRALFAPSRPAAPPAPAPGRPSAPPSSRPGRPGSAPAPLLARPRGRIWSPPATPGASPAAAGSSPARAGARPARPGVPRPSPGLLDGRGCASCRRGAPRSLEAARGLRCSIVRIVAHQRDRRPDSAIPLRL